jgi:hypothetical protein
VKQDAHGAGRPADSDHAFVLLSFKVSNPLLLALDTRPQVMPREYAVVWGLSPLPACPGLAERFRP